LVELARVGEPDAEREEESRLWRARVVRRKIEVQSAVYDAVSALRQSFDAFAISRYQALRPVNAPRQQFRVEIDLMDVAEAVGGRKRAVLALLPLGACGFMGLTHRCTS